MTAQPPRLKHSPELGAVIRAAGEANVPPERLAANAASIKALIVTGASTALWKLLVPLLLLLAIATPIVIRLVTREPEPPPPPPAVAAAVPPDAAPDASPDAPPYAPPDATPPDAMPVHEHHRTAAADAAVPDAPPPAKSELAAQIELYQAARDAGQHGDPARGIALIDELLQHYPSTPLRAEADLTRADFLARANRLDEATRAIEALVDDAAHSGRRGELLRTLGDLYRRQNDCAHAIAAYDRALAERLGDRDRADVMRGRDRCTHP